ncbi:MAG: flagellar hook-associated protein FlgL [Bacteriovoracaceae bacterium]|nr:flagellar hook-associated protein FlgL [Bacteriovoracaceae bacterium]
MSRVSENSSTNSVAFALNKAKSKLEDLQLKGSTLKSMSRPSDNPLANVKALEISSRMEDNKQYLKNVNFAVLQLETTEKTIEQITNLLVKAKDVAIAQSSDFYNEDARTSVSHEIDQVYNQILALANKRIGQRHIFAGNATLKRPFGPGGEYFGDEGKQRLEVAKDFLIPINLNGKEVFFTSDDKSPQELPTDKPANEEVATGRDLASVERKKASDKEFANRNNIFTLVSSLAISLKNNDPLMVQGTLEKFDEAISRLITLRTKVGSLHMSALEAKDLIDADNVANAGHRSTLVDADVAELFSDLAKQKHILETTYKSSSTLLNRTLLDFL